MTHFAVTIKPRTKVTFEGCYSWVPRLADLKLRLLCIEQPEKCFQAVGFGK